MKYAIVVSLAIFTAGLQLDARAEKPEAKGRLGIPFRLEELSEQQQGTATTVEELESEQQATSDTLESVTQDISDLTSRIEQIEGAPAICDSTCERGVLKIHFADGNAVCPPVPSLILHCDPYQCSTDGTSCLEICQDNFDCQIGSACCTATGCLFTGTLGHCLPDVMRCSGNTLTAPDGDQYSCGNHICVGSTCAYPCRSTAVCMPGTQCDADGDCVVP